MGANKGQPLSPIHLNGFFQISAGRHHFAQKHEFLSLIAGFFLQFALCGHERILAPFSFAGWDFAHNPLLRVAELIDEKQFVLIR